jgi:hypothetical protein
VNRIRATQRYTCPDCVRPHQERLASTLCFSTQSWYEPLRGDGDLQLRLLATEAYDKLVSLDDHSELIRLILVETSLLVQKYENVRRRYVPHVAELAGLLNVLWQEVEMARNTPWTSGRGADAPKLILAGSLSGAAPTRTSGSQGVGSEHKPWLRTTSGSGSAHLCSYYRRWR